MGLVLTMKGLFALTAQLDISFRAAVPINEPLVARAWMESHDGRKLRMRAVITCNNETVTEATALFISIDPARFVANQ